MGGGRPYKAAMKHKDGERLPDDLQETVDRLRAHKPGGTPLELAEIKLRAMAQASRASASRQGRSSFMRSKLVTTVLTLALVGSGGSAAVLAGGKGDHGNSGNGQYCPKGHGHGKHGGKHGSQQNRGS